MGTGAGAYMVGMPGGHSGPGMAAFTSKLFWDYYAFMCAWKVAQIVCRELGIKNLDEIDEPAERRAIADI